MEVRICNAGQEVDFDRDAVDVAIQFGEGQWKNVQQDLLFHDEIEPVCSPRFLAEHAPDRRYPQSLLRQRLLVSRYRRTDWDVWMEASELGEAGAGAERMSCGTTLLCWQAAVDGLGMAIGQPALLKSELASGQLVRPFARPLLREQGYYLLRPAAQRESLKVNLFRDWLLSVCRQATPQHA